MDLTHRLSAFFHLALAFMLALFLVTPFFAAVQPSVAEALEIEKCTARPNQDSGAGVLGSKETRVTWEGITGKNQSVSAFSLTFPEGTKFETDDTRVTMLSGADLMDREFLEANVTSTGQTIDVVLAKPVSGDTFIRIEVYGVFFPMEGGAMQITGTYTLANGTVEDMPAIPAIDVLGVSIPEMISMWFADQPLVQAWNSNLFLHLFFDPTIIVTSVPVVFKGFLMALAIVAIAFPLAIPVGLLLALCRMSKLAILRAIGSVYVNVVRGTPLFLQIYIAFFGLPLAGINPPPMMLGIIVLAMNSAAYLCEIFRAGIQSIPKGQFEAAASLGMNGVQTMLFVIIPQTVRRVIPTMTSEFILLYKDTSLLAAVGIMEVVMYAKTIVAATGSITPYIVAACFYLVLTLPLAKVVGNFENKLAAKDGASTKKKRAGRTDSMGLGASTTLLNGLEPATETAGTDASIKSSSDNNAQSAAASDAKNTSNDTSSISATDKEDQR